MIFLKLGLGGAFKEAISQSVTSKDDNERALVIVKMLTMIAHCSPGQKWMLNDLNY
jgi:hypothetical protein